MITTEERISNAELLNNLVGIPWEEKGINYDGCDCVGIAKLYYEAKDIKVITDLSKKINEVKVISALAKGFSSRALLIPSSELIINFNQ